MKIRLVDYLKHRKNDSFERRLVVLTNLMASMLSLLSIISSEILSSIKPDPLNTDNKYLAYNTIFWVIVFICSLFLAELSLYESFFQISRKLSIYLYSFFLIPLGLYLTGSVEVTSMYYVLCIVLLNIIAVSRERYIINPFLLIIIYTYIIISYRHPELLPPLPSKEIIFLHFLIDTPIVLTVTAIVVSAMTETYRKENQEIRTQNRRLEQIVRSDRLTGLYNKVYLNEQLPILLSNSHKKKSPLSLFIVDIDFFKNYNNLYGNIKGDSCLLEVTNILKRNCTGITDNIYRFGGEEFIIIAPDTDYDSARILAESIREDFHIRQIDNYRSTICNYVTVSIGVHCYSGLFPTTPEEIIKKADSALYTVKRKGRDGYYIDTSSET